MSDFPTVVPYGTAPSGEAVSLITLGNATISCQIITYGATLRTLFVPDRNARPVDVVLGYDTLQDYVEQNEYFGATVGRFSNRIAQSRFALNGQEYTLTCNDGPNQLHGGKMGFSDRVWTLEEVGPECAVLSLFSEDGEEGFHGNLKVRVTYRLQGGTLSIRYQAVCDADTVCSLTNHSYFNLAGHHAGRVMDQTVVLNVQNYAPSDEAFILLGTLEPVEGTPLDLRVPTRIGTHMDHPQLKAAGGYDHSFTVNGPTGSLRPAGQVTCEETGITLQVSTTLPAVHFYTANTIADGSPGKNGCAYGPYHAFCMETQYFPDAPNQPAFPSAVLKAGEEYDHETSFTFGVK